MTEVILNILTILIATFTLLMVLTAISFIFFTRIPYVPSKLELLQKYFRENPPEEGKKFYDLGAGDGRVLFLAEKEGLNATGYEISPLPFLLGKIQQIFTGSKVKLLFKNFLKQNISDANYVYCYLFPKLTEDSFQKVKTECKPGTYFICNTFSLKSQKPESTLESTKSKNKLYIYKT